MTLKSLFITAAFLFISLTYSQTQEYKKPDYDAIKKNIESKESNYHYDKLLKRLYENDTLLSNDEYIHLYYGAALQKNYQPYGESKYAKELQKFYNRDSWEKKDYKEFIELASKSLKEYPIDLRLMNFLAYIQHKDGNDDMAQKISTNFHGIIGAIMSTGSGKTCDDALHVLWINHEYVILNLFDLESQGQSLIGNCDYLRFEKDKYKIDGLYFNVSKLFEQSSKLLKEK